MQQINGKIAFGGIAIGKIKEVFKENNVVRRVKIDDTQAEISRFRAAKDQATEELKALYDKAVKEVGEANAAIFEVHQMMLEDEDYLDSICNIIAVQSVNAEFAVATTGDNFARMFADMDDDYMKERAADVKDISERVIRILSRKEETVHADDEEKYIIAADDLAPSETIQLERERVLAFVTRQGSTNSHTAILARTMNIPALVQTDVELLKEYHGIDAVVDGLDGKLYLDPEETVLAELVQKKEACGRERAELEKLIGLDNVTRDGRKINVYANIGSPEDVDKVLLNDAGGIGLFRSEFLYLGREDYPSEEEQFEIYKEVLSRMEGKKVIIRTLDIGADKQVDYFKLPKEENPAMGYRAIRICLDRIDVFKTQLRAIYRASVYGTAAIMFPMIISVKEILRIKEIVEEVKVELTAAGIEIAPVELGIMVETPAAVMISEELAKEVSFFSIGTNDLTQYTLAIDRQNQSLDTIYDSHHPAVLRMIQMTIENGHKGGAWVGICGELGADTTLTKTFVDMGIDELSVSPTYVLGLRKAIREI